MRETREDVAPETGASFLVRLRTETAALQASTERRIAPAERLADVHSYGRLLGALYPLYGFVEMRLESFQDWHALHPPLDVWRRRRAYLLVADLRALGVEVTYSHAVVVPEIDRFAQAFGALYAVESSRLAGVVLARHVSASLGDVAEDALGFLRSNDETGIGQLWDELCTALDRYAADAEECTRDAISAAAADTFRCLDRQLERWQV